MAAAKEPSQEVPIFLRKTYHLINTCDPDIAGWSDDGETFVVKDPQKFQEDCIPTYFKHAKFASFVRQLNFYSFRKIKNSDTIRIDPKVEAATANYWRFKHEHFRQGHPELLTKIKRMNSAQKTAAPPKAAVEKMDKASKSEVQSLKKQIEAMSKNIDELTAMVQKVTLKQGEQEKFAEDGNGAGSKRKKVEFAGEIDAMAPEPVLSDISMAQPDEMISGMDLDDISMPPSMPSPVHSHREASVGSAAGSDTDFVDDLFKHFTDDDGADTFVLNELSSEVTELPPIQAKQSNNPNYPDPELMSRLGEALALLPKDIQVLIVDRLIAAITSTDSLENNSVIADAMSQDTKGKAKIAPEEAPQTTVDTENSQEATFPLAAATLAALLHHYSSQGKGKGLKSVQKTIPVIPVHA